MPGARVVPVEITPGGELDLAALKLQLKAPVKILALTHVSNVLGTVNPVADLCAGLFAAMDGLQRALCAAIRPGRDYREVHLEAHRRIGALLHDAAIVRSLSSERQVTMVWASGRPTAGSSVVVRQSGSAARST